MKDIKGKKNVVSTTTSSVRTPSIKDIETALRIYYENSEIGNHQIKELFGSRSSATIARLKRIAKNEMSKRDIYSYGLNKVNTTVAYEVWGIDVDDLEKRAIKLSELRNLNLQQ